MSPARRRRGNPAPLFAALGDPTRLELLSRLSDGARHSIRELTDGFEVSRQAVTKHLQVLGDAGLVDHERVGRETRFAMRPKAITEAQDYLARVAAQWDASIRRLRRLVEE